jgi:hypothetical protein
VGFLHLSSVVGRKPAETDRSGISNHCRDTGEKTMSIHEQVTAAERKRRKLGLSLDGWAVAIALFLTAVVRLGVLERVPW